MPRPSFMGTAAAGSMVAGTSVAVFNMFYWAQYQHYFDRPGAGGSPSSILSFYVAEAVSIFLLLLGFYFSYRYLRMKSSTSPFSSSLAVIGSAISDRRMARAGAVGAAIYGLLYAFTSSILVFQPSVDFATTYGTTGVASWGSLPCCGDIGTLPWAALYLSPAHLAVQLVPLSVLLLFIVPPLVGLNLSIALFSVRRTVSKVTGRWVVACGAAVGLFTACPTCAGFFLAESVGGIGATTLAVALAPYQALFIAISIPLLIFMPFFFAMRVRKAGTSVARSSLLRGVETKSENPLAAGNR